MAGSLRACRFRHTHHKHLPLSEPPERQAATVSIITTHAKFVQCEFQGLYSQTVSRACTALPR